MVPRLFDQRSAKPRCPLESQLQRELNRTWPTELIEGIKGPIPNRSGVPSTAEVLTQHLGGLTKLGVKGLRASQIPYGRRKIGVIQNIEEFGSELELHAIVYRKLAMDCKVPLDSAETPQGIPA
jgi:hypothetical protein